MNFNDPASRAGYIERHGIEAYNSAMADHHRRTVVETVNGHAIRTVQTRFGCLFAVGDTGTAYATLQQARAFARESATE